MKRRIERLLRMNPDCPLNGTFFAAVGLIVLVNALICGIVLWHSYELNQKLNQEVSERLHEGVRVPADGLFVLTIHKRNSTDGGVMQLEACEGYVTIKQEDSRIIRSLAEREASDK